MGIVILLVNADPDGTDFVANHKWDHETRGDVFGTDGLSGLCVLLFCFLSLVNGF